MVVSPADSHIGAPRITQAAFLRLLVAAKSPAHNPAFGVNAGYVYEYAVANNLDPLFLLAMFKHESNFGKAGTATQTHSWGNTRLPIVGPTQPVTTTTVRGGIYEAEWDDVQPVMVQGRSGEFPKWANWVDGGKSTIDRLVSTKYPAGKAYGYRTIYEIFNHPSGAVWAPAGDLNDPNGYLRAVLDYMSKEQDIFMAGNPNAKLTTSQEFIPQGNPNRPGNLMRGGSPNWITVHEVGNLNPQGGTARATRNFVHNGGGGENVSFQAVVGDKESIQLLPWNEIGWHAGDGSGDGNWDSIAIETQQVGDWGKTVRNLAKLVAALMKEFSLPISRVVQHNYWSGKNCPQYLRSGRAPLTNAPNWNWDTFIRQVELEYKALFTTVERVPLPRADGAGPIDVRFKHPTIPGWGIPVNIKVTVWNPDEEKFYVGEWDNGVYKNWVAL